MRLKRLNIPEKPKHYPNCDPRDIVTWKLAAQKSAPVEVLMENIWHAMEQNGPYTHNMISIILRQIADIHGKDAANKVLVNMGLDKLGWSPEP